MERFINIDFDVSKNLEELEGEVWGEQDFGVTFSSNMFCTEEKGN